MEQVNIFTDEEMNFLISKNDNNLIKQNLIDELIEIYDENPKVNITRDYYITVCRSPTMYKKYFGTWSEFKAEAGLSETKLEKKFFNNVSKHSEKDVLRELNASRENWGLNYLRPSNNRFKTVLLFSDLHDINADPFFVRCLIDTAKRVQPEYIIGNGDIYDLTEFGKYTVDPREYNPSKRFFYVYDFWKSIRNASPNSEIYHIEGNHEYRLIRQLAENNPAMREILSDYHEMDVQKLFKLDELEINYFGRADLTAFVERDIKNELNKNYLILNDQVLFHHFPQGKAFGYPGAHGHQHKHIVYPAFSPQFGAFEWHQLGCGHKRRNEYQITMGEQWSIGFMLCHMDTITKRTQFEYIDCSSVHCFIGGLLYTRNEEELKYFI